MATRHECKPGDHICKVAFQYGVEWGKLWAANSDLQSSRKRGNPNLLYQGVDRAFRQYPDSLKVPNKELKETGGGLDKINPFVLPGETRLFLRLRILREDFQPVAAGTQYALTVMQANGQAWDRPGPGWIPPATIVLPPMAKGVIEVRVPPTAVSAVLTVRMKPADSDAGTPPGADAAPGGVQGDSPVTWDLKIGALNPIMELAPDKWCIPGVQQRLNNLGFDSGPVDGIRGPLTTAAVKRFQGTFGLTVDGLPGQGETQPKLQEVHDTNSRVVLPAP